MPKVTILLKKTYNSYQEAVTELDQAETLGFVLQDVSVSQD